MKEYRWCAIDAEGDAGERGLLGVAFCSDALRAYITDHDQIRAKLREHARNGYTFIAHNAGYDLPVIFWQLGVSMKATYYNGRFNHGSWKYDERRAACELWDTGAISGIRSLADLGIASGTPKLPTPQRLLGRDPDRYDWICAAHNRGECEECYALRDAEIPYQFMLLLAEQLRTWGVAPGHTIAAMAMNVWKALERPPPIALLQPKIEKLATPAYVGGRVECCKLGMVPGICVSDIASAYPAAMAETLYPDPSSMVYLREVSPAKVPWDREGVAEVSLRVPPSYVPPLPHLHQGERIFPSGSIRGCWTLLELRHAVQLGADIRWVHRAAWGARNLSPFANFVGALWFLREEYRVKGDPRELLAKLLMNNLYGRIGMRQDIERRVIGRHPLGESVLKLKGKNWSIFDNVVYADQTRQQRFGNDYRNVLWAAQTTSAVRVKLHRLMTLQGGNLLYCDTDSIITQGDPVGLGEGLGQLRLEGRFDRIMIAGPKLYALQRREQDMPDSWSVERCAPHQLRRCEECRWLPKAKGIPKAHALRFLREGEATFSRPIKPTEQHSRAIKAGTWIEVTRRKRYKVHRRTPINPDALRLEDGWSDTLAPYIG